MKATAHDYQHCLVDNYFNDDVNGRYSSWSEFKRAWLGFAFDEYDDTYHFLFRFDINQYDEEELFSLELCFMLQRKGIYCHILVEGIKQKELDEEIHEWLKGRKRYMLELWKEVAE